MRKTFVEEFPKVDVTEEQIKALCSETMKEVIGCASCTYRSDDERKLWVMTSVVEMLA